MVNCMRPIFKCSAVLISVSLMACSADHSEQASKEQASVISTKEALGEMLFHDVNLSQNRTQACATCHNPAKGFADSRDIHGQDKGMPAATSLGDNGTSIGDRNAPTASYAAFSPKFSYGERPRAPSQQTSGVGAYQGYLGGQFWDGREAHLAGQAGGPPTNPDEMGLKTKTSAVERLKENPIYVKAFESIYGSDVFGQVDVAYAAMTDAISKFEMTPLFFPFDSKYDRMLSGEFQFNPLSDVAVGRTLFFSSDFSCAACHQLRNSRTDKGEVFSSFEYHNIGVPENKRLRAINGVTKIDLGLALNPNVSDKQAQKGKFKVPTLRNVAVTGPYMHNGVFNDLETVLAFYEHAKLRGRDALNGAPLSDNSVNPETGQTWANAEVVENVAHDLLAGSQKELNKATIEDFVCFLMSLTDRRYEHLLDQSKVESCGLSDQHLVNQ